MELDDLITQLIENKGVSAYEVSKATGLSQGTLSRILSGETKKLSLKTKDILANYFNINIEKFGKVDNIESLELDKKEFFNTENKNKPQGVPYYEDIEATAGVISSYSDFKEMPTFYINYEHFNDCTAYVPVFGDSMYPNFCSGEIIAIKKVFNLDVIFWGEAYFVVTNSNANDIRAAKLLFPHEDDSKIILRSSNPNYKGDTVINKSDIIHLYLIKGKIHRKHL